jgi:Na+/H+ antiporter NhaA
LSVQVGEAELVKDLRRWVNDGLMTLFFLVVGLEISRQLKLGELRHWQTAAVPAAAALGGMVTPALPTTPRRSSGCCLPPRSGIGPCSTPLTGK